MKNEHLSSSPDLNLSHLNSGVRDTLTNWGTVLKDVNGALNGENTCKHACFCAYSLKIYMKAQENDMFAYIFSI